jgi:uncharacterized protein YndB with AHSA1/START domain
MTITAHIYQIHIAADVDTVWAAITQSEWTREYFHGTSYAEGPTPGARFRTVMADGDDAIDGVVEEMTPPADGRPGRFVQTWHVLYDAAMAQEPPGRVEWTVEQVGEGLTRVRLVHGDLAGSPLTWANVKDGWVWVLDAMKSVLETGRCLPRPDHAGAEPSTAEDTEGEWHRRQAVAANNAAFDLLEAERDAAGDEELLRSAYAAAHHWSRARGRAAVNDMRADYLVARALVATGQPERGLLTAERALERCTAEGIADPGLVELRASILETLTGSRHARSRPRPSDALAARPPTITPAARS